MAQETFQNCPNCDAMILSDTGTCPECGQVLKEGAEGSGPAAERIESPKRACPKCGDMVPAGLVRCWSCNSFMDETVAEKYKTLIKNPQPIIFSDTPPNQRTEIIPPRFRSASGGGYARVFDADDDSDDPEFTLQGDEPVRGVDLELDNAGNPQPTAEQKSDAAEKRKSSMSPQEESSTENKSKETAAEANADDLLDIALTQEKETGQRQRIRVAQARRKRILIPCLSCGSWLRVREEQSGRTVRCRNCQTPVFVPEIKTKEKSVKKEKAPELTLDWIDDIHLHLIAPKDVVLKPGSLKDTWQLADCAFHEDTLYLVGMGDPPKKKKGLFSRGRSEEDVLKQRTAIRDAIRKSGSISNLPHGDLYSVNRDAISAVRLLQPLAHAYESMFAGVHVFGEGMIAIYLPITLEEGRQAYCSFPISKYREFAQQFAESMNVKLPANENGVPKKDEVQGYICQYTQVRIESVQHHEYYRNDPAYELELAGYRCEACGAAVSEAGRKKNKLGGSAGKSIAKAKCPKCSAAMGNHPLYQIVKAPEQPEVDEHTAAADSAAATAGSSVTADALPEVE